MYPWHKFHTHPNHPYFSQLLTKPPHSPFLRKNKPPPLPPSSAVTPRLQHDIPGGGRHRSTIPTPIPPRTQQHTRRPLMMMMARPPWRRLLLLLKTQKRARSHLGARLYRSRALLHLLKIIHAVRVKVARLRPKLELLLLGNSLLGDNLGQALQPWGLEPYSSLVSRHSHLYPHGEKEEEKKNSQDGV